MMIKRREIRDTISVYNIYTYSIDYTKNITAGYIDRKYSYNGAIHNLMDMKKIIESTSSNFFTNRYKKRALKEIELSIKNINSNEFSI